MNHVRQNFLSSWTIFCPFTLLTSQKIKILKKWKKHLEILSFYTCAPEVKIIWCMVLEIWSAAGRIFVIFGPFFALYPTDNLKNQNFNKKKDTWIYNHFTRVFHKWKSYVWFLRCVVQQTTFFGILGHFLAFYPTNNPKNKIWKKWRKMPGDIIILYLCATNDDHMRDNFLSFWAIFCSFTTLTRKIKILKKWKRGLEILSFYTSVP